MNTDHEQQETIQKIDNQGDGDLATMKWQGLVTQDAKRQEMSARLIQKCHNSR
jgi:hypothetical protein